MNTAEETKSTKTAKGEQTKALILNSALELLRDLGYEKTTMRAIAKKAGVSLGNAYHYFGSKDHLIQAFYHRTHEEHLAASLPVLKKELAKLETQGATVATEAQALELQKNVQSQAALSGVSYSSYTPGRGSTGSGCRTRGR